MKRADIVNALMGTPYLLGAQGGDAVDCYSCTTILQLAIFGREMPGFAMPAQAGRSAIAAAIAVHSVRRQWVEVDHPVDGSIVTMARNICGYHLGTWLDDDGGVIVHAVEELGVVADTLPSLEAIGWRKFRFHVPA